MRHLAAPLLALLISCSPPSDPVLLGQLCYPSTTGCPNASELDRATTLGRNVLDVRLTNVGDSTTRAFVLVSQPTFSTPTDAGTPDASFDPTNAPGSDALASREFDLAAGDFRADRFVGSELGRDPDLLVEVFCDTPTCAITMDYVLVVEAIECVVSQDCSNGWSCDDEAGQCVECLSGRDDQCAEGQTCELGQCTPPQDTSCASVPGGPPPQNPLALITLLAVLIGVRTSRRPPRKLALAALCLSSVLLASDASAQQTESMRAELSFGAGPRFFTGDVGEQSDPGAGLYVTQELRWKYVGAALTLDTAFFVTRPDSLPLGRDLGTYSVRIGPRLYLPTFDWLELYASTEYERMGLAANSLVALTGTALSYDALALGAGARFATASLFAKIGSTYHVVFGFPGDLISIDLTVGLSGF